MTPPPEELARYAAALMRCGYAVEVDLSFRHMPVAPVIGKTTEEWAVMGTRVMDAIETPEVAWCYLPATPDDNRPRSDARSGAGPELPSHIGDCAMPTAAMWISDDVTYTSPIRQKPTPRDATDHGLGGLLDRVSRVLERPAGTVMLAGTIAARVGMRGKAPGVGSRREHSAIAAPVIQSARQCGWTITELRPWTIARRTEVDARGRKVTRTIHIGVLPWINPKRFPLYAETPALLVARLLRYRQLTGAPYHGDTPGLVGHDIIRAQTRRRVPHWLPRWVGITPAEQATEAADTWQATEPPVGRYWHGYDATVQYLGAAGVTTLAIDQLAHRDDPAPVEPRNLPGYYLITVPAWHYAGQLPHPAGAGRVRGDQAWVTAPTLDLLYEVAHVHGRIAEPEVHESWTADGGRVLRDWAGTLSRAFQEIGPRDEPGSEVEVMRDAVKATYTGAIGLLAREGGTIHRPDWEHAIRAQARCNLWRRIWREFADAGRWPGKIDADNVFYASDDQDPHADWPATFKRDDQGILPGTFKWSKETTVIEETKTVV